MVHFPLKRPGLLIQPMNFKFQIKEVPILNEARRCHGCDKMTLNGRTILIVAGEGLETLDSVEILDPSANNVWTPGLYLKFISRRNCFDLKFSC